MSNKEIAYRIEELQIDAEKVNSVQNALFEAIYRGSNALETYEWAFVSLGDLTFALKNNLEDLTSKVFDNLKKESVDCEVWENDGKGISTEV